MTREEVLVKINEIFRDAFDDESIEVSDATTANDIADWDSLMQMNLITQLEEAFGVSLKGRDIMRVKSYETGLQLIRKKLNEKEG